MADAADEVISVEAAPAADGIHSNGDGGVELAVLSGGGVGAVVEECVLCVITDETSTDWARSRFSYSLPLSSDAKDLYTAVANQAGMHTHLVLASSSCFNVSSLHWSCKYRQRSNRFSYIIM